VPDRHFYHLFFCLGLLRVHTTIPNIELVNPTFVCVQRIFVHREVVAVGRGSSVGSAGSVGSIQKFVRRRSLAAGFCCFTTSFGSHLRWLSGASIQGFEQELSWVVRSAQSYRCVFVLVCVSVCVCVCLCVCVFEFLRVCTYVVFRIVGIGGQRTLVFRS
jgi:hypothetical protein